MWQLFKIFLLENKASLDYYSLSKLEIFYNYKSFFKEPTKNFESYNINNLNMVNLIEIRDIKNIQP